MYVSLATGLLAALHAPAALAGAGPGKPPPLELRPVDYAMQGRDLCYPSGLHVAVVWDDRLPVVSLTMVLDRGSASDPAEAAGAAHLLEHIWFSARPGGGAEVRDRLHALGALNNAFTGPDTTTYTTLGSAERLEDLLALEAARLAAPLEGVGPEELAGEQRIVASEHRRAIGLMGSEALRLLPGTSSPRGTPTATCRWRPWNRSLPSPSNSSRPWRRTPTSPPRAMAGQAGRPRPREGEARERVGPPGRSPRAKRSTSRPCTCPRTSPRPAPSASTTG